MTQEELCKRILEILFNFDSAHPVHKNFRPGAGPFPETQLVKIIKDELGKHVLKSSGITGYPRLNRKYADLVLGEGKVIDWFIEAKVIRVRGDNEKAYPYMDKLLHPLSNSCLVDTRKLLEVDHSKNKALLLIQFDNPEMEHNDADFGVNHFVKIINELYPKQRFDVHQEVKTDLIHEVFKRLTITLIKI